MKNERGVALAISMFVMAFITALSTVYISRVVQEKNTAAVEINSAKSSYAAEAGANDGLNTLYNLINQYMLTKVSSTEPSVVSSHASSYASANNGVGFLLAYVKDGATALLTASGTEALYTSSDAIDNGSYAYTIRMGAKAVPSSPKANVWDFPFYFKIQTTSTNSGVSKKLVLHGDFTVRVQKDNFARYSLFTVHQTMPNGTRVWFTDTTHFTGPLFTNTGYSFAKNPAGTFNGLVKQVDVQACFYNNNNSFLADADANGTIDLPFFNSGFQRGAPSVTMPTSSQETSMVAQATGGSSYGSTGVYLPRTGTTLKGGIYVYGDTSLSMSLDASNRQKLTFTQGTTTSEITLDRTTGQTILKKAGVTTVYTGLPDGVDDVGTLVYVNGSISSLGGTVQRDNQMTIATKNDIVIANHIRYQDYTPGSGTPGTVGYVPPTAEGTNNVLGIFTWHGDVEVATSAPDNLDVYGTVMAKEGQFTVINYDQNSPRGIASVLGGVISNYYGAFGTFNSSTGLQVSGYGRNFIYDTRMETSLTPPYFPTLNTFIAFTNDIDDKLFWQQGGF